MRGEKSASRVPPLCREVGSSSYSCILRSAGSWKQGPRQHCLWGVAFCSTEHVQPWPWNLLPRSYHQELCLIASWYLTALSHPVCSRPTVNRCSLSAWGMCCGAVPSLECCSLDFSLYLSVRLSWLLLDLMHTSRSDTTHLVFSLVQSRSAIPLSILSILCAKQIVSNLPCKMVLHGPHW